MTTSSSGNDTPAKPSAQKIFDSRQLSTLVEMETPGAVHNEVLHILGLIDPDFNTAPVSHVFRFTVDLYKGQMRDYKACNTDYHNLRHITDTYLAMARLLHGAMLSSGDFSDREIVLGLVGALMHDTGMIQESWDSQGTGAKYTKDHVKISMNFVTKHGADLQLAEGEIADLRDMIQCTDLLADIPSINFSTPNIELLGKILGTADLIAQMADRTYLEKLLFLYHEYREAEMGNYKDEKEFLHKTLTFFEVSDQRFKKTLDGTSRYMVPHFTARWGITENLYTLSLNNQRKFLEKILASEDLSIYRELKRSNIVEQVREKFGKTGLAE